MKENTSKISEVFSLFFFRLVYSFSEITQNKIQNLFNSFGTTYQLLYHSAIYRSSIDFLLQRVFFSHLITLMKISNIAGISQKLQNLTRLANAKY